jgi:hypothetical protein
MAKGESGRIVLEVDQNLKKTLYAILALEQKTLKDWFVESAEKHIKDKKLELLNIIGNEESEV